MYVVSNADFCVRLLVLRLTQETLYIETYRNNLKYVETLRAQGHKSTSLHHIHVSMAIPPQQALDYAMQHKLLIQDERQPYVGDNHVLRTRSHAEERQVARIMTIPYLILL